MVRMGRRPPQVCYLTLELDQRSGLNGSGHYGVQNPVFLYGGELAYRHRHPTNCELRLPYSIEQKSVMSTSAMTAMQAMRRVRRAVLGLGANCVGVATLSWAWPCC